MCSYSWRVPLRTSGQLSLHTSWDLGGLGASEGIPVAYNWTAQALLPALLPWLAMLGLLALKPNHGWSAWSIWLPLLALAASWNAVQLSLQQVPNDIVHLLLDGPRSLAFGLAALWLLAPCLGRRSRWLTFAGKLGVLAGVSVFSYAVSSGWDEGAVERITALSRYGTFIGYWATGFAQAGFVVFLACVISGAMTLTGLGSEGLHRAFRVWLRLPLALLISAFAVGVPAYLLAWPRETERVPFISVTGVGLAVSAVCLASLLPFLILSAVNPLFRDRLKGLLRLDSKSSPQTRLAEPAVCNVE